MENGLEYNRTTLDGVNVGLYWTRWSIEAMWWYRGCSVVVISRQISHPNETIVTGKYRISLKVWYPYFVISSSRPLSQCSHYLKSHFNGLDTDANPTYYMVSSRSSNCWPGGRRIKPRADWQLLLPSREGDTVHREIMNYSSCSAWIVTPGEWASAWRHVGFMTPQHVKSIDWWALCTTWRIYVEEVLPTAEKQLSYYNTCHRMHVDVCFKWVRSVKHQSMGGAFLFTIHEVRGRGLPALNSLPTRFEWSLEEIAYL